MGNNGHKEFVIDDKLSLYRSYKTQKCVAMAYGMMPNMVITYGTAI